MKKHSQPPQELQVRLHWEVCISDGVKLLRRGEKNVEEKEEEKTAGQLQSGHIPLDKSQTVSVLIKQDKN